MGVKTCRVTMHDMEGIDHTVEVTAASLYEAVALGLKMLRGNDWVIDVEDDLRIVSVVVKSVEVTHAVKFIEFHEWVERKGCGSPAGMTRRRKVREILGLSNGK